MGFFSGRATVTTRSTDKGSTSSEDVPEQSGCGCFPFMNRRGKAQHLMSELYRPLRSTPHSLVPPQLPRSSESSFSESSVDSPTSAGLPGAHGRHVAYGKLYSTYPRTADPSGSLPSMLIMEDPEPPTRSGRLPPGLPQSSSTCLDVVTAGSTSSFLEPPAPRRVFTPRSSLTDTAASTTLTLYPTQAPSLTMSLSPVASPRTRLAQPSSPKSAPNVPRRTCAPSHPSSAASQAPDSRLALGLPVGAGLLDTSSVPTLSPAESSPANITPAVANSSSPNHVSAPPSPQHIFTVVPAPSSTPYCTPCGSISVDVFGAVDAASSATHHTDMHSAAPSSPDHNSTPFSTPPSTPYSTPCGSCAAVDAARAWDVASAAAVHPQLDGHIRTSALATSTLPSSVHNRPDVAEVACAPTPSPLGHPAFSVCSAAAPKPRKGSDVFAPHDEEAISDLFVDCEGPSDRLQAVLASLEDSRGIASNPSSPLPPGSAGSACSALIESFSAYAGGEAVSPSIDRCDVESAHLFSSFRRLSEPPQPTGGSASLHSSPSCIPSHASALSPSLPLPSSESSRVPTPAESHSKVAAGRITASESSTLHSLPSCLGNNGTLVGNTFNVADTSQLLPTSDTGDVSDSDEASNLVRLTTSIDALFAQQHLRRGSASVESFVGAEELLHCSLDEYMRVAVAGGAPDERIPAEDASSSHLLLGDAELADLAADGMLANTGADSAFQDNNSFSPHPSPINPSAHPSPIDTPRLLNPTYLSPAPNLPSLPTSPSSSTSSWPGDQLAVLESNHPSRSPKVRPDADEIAVCLSFDRSLLSESDLLKRNLLTPREQCLGAEPLSHTPDLQTYRSNRSCERSAPCGVKFNERVWAFHYEMDQPPVAAAEVVGAEWELLTRDGPRPGWAAEKFCRRDFLGDSNSDGSEDYDWD